MSPLQRANALLALAHREAQALIHTDGGLFAGGPASGRVAGLAADPALSERVDAYSARFGCLQDTLGDKLLPAALSALLESVGTVLDNLHRAEKLGWVDSAEQWVTVRRLRNRLTHEYEPNPARLAEALDTAHAAVPLLLSTLGRTERALAAVNEPPG